MIVTLSDDLEYFLKGFKQNNTYKYVDAIDQMFANLQTHLEVDYNDLDKMYPNIAQ